MSKRAKKAAAPEGFPEKEPHSGTVTNIDSALSRELRTHAAARAAAQTILKGQSESLVPLS